MTMADVQDALAKGTVIFNAAGAHIPRLAGPCLAVTEATLLPCALNLYVTAPGKRTSAPPHTDKQDVCVVQTSGRKHWKVFSPPDSAVKPSADMFARGKGDDSLPLHLLESDDDTLGCELLLETILNPGDVLFVPAAFPHTTSTATEGDSPEAEETSIHLTLGIDHHIWELDYVSARRLALRRAGVADTALGQMRDQDNGYVGKANELLLDIRRDLFAELPLGLLDDDDEKVAPLVDKAASELERISRAVDEATASAVDASLWKHTIDRVRQEGIELLEIHREMYLAALEEGRIRKEEDAMTAHLDKSIRRTMTPERLQRLSLFRVKRYFDQIEQSKRALKDWSYAGKASSSVGRDAEQALPDNWAFAMPVKVGDQVEADLGGAFFPAIVSRATGGTYDVNFFDGDRETGLDRSQIKLLAPPSTASQDVDISTMTPKQLKRWKKEQEKLSK
jgi:Cupin superfamily protein